MKTTSLFRSFFTSSIAALSTLVHSISFSLTGPSKLSTSRILTPNRKAFKPDRGAVLTNIACGRRWHHATSFFTNQNLRRHSSNETGLVTA